MFTQYIRIHATTADQSQTTGIAHRTCQPPAAGPNHAGLYEGNVCIEKLRDSIRELSHDGSKDNRGDWEKCPAFLREEIGKLITRLLPLY